MNDFITLYGNLLFSLSTVFYGAFSITWIFDRSIPVESRRFLLNILARDLAVHIRITWWTTSLALAPEFCLQGITQEQCTYQQNMFDWRWAPTILSGIIYLLADINLVARIEEMTKVQKLSWVAAGNLLAATFALWFNL